MKMKSLLAVAISAAFFTSTASANEEILTGDTKLACEAILCLSSGKRPNECEPSIRKFHSIHRDTPSRTIQARRAFLHKCPSGNEEGMDELIDALAEGAGRCDAASLNKLLGKNKYTFFFVRKKPKKPAYCRAYDNHPWIQADETKLEPVYCEVSKGTDRWSNSRGTETVQCGWKWVDVE